MEIANTERKVFNSIVSFINTILAVTLSSVELCNGGEIAVAKSGLTSRKLLVTNEIFSEISFRFASFLPFQDFGSNEKF